MFNYHRSLSSRVGDEGRDTQEKKDSPAHGEVHLNSPVGLPVWRKCLVGEKSRTLSEVVAERAAREDVVARPWSSNEVVEGSCLVVGGRVLSSCLIVRRGFVLTQTSLTLCPSG